MLPFTAAHFVPASAQLLQVEHTKVILPLPRLVSVKLANQHKVGPNLKFFSAVTKQFQALLDKSITILCYMVTLFNIGLLTSRRTERTVRFEMRVLCVTHSIHTDTPEARLNYVPRPPPKGAESP